MQQGRGGMGSKKHGQSGKVHNVHHFTGKRGGKKIKRKPPKEKRLKQQKKNVNKYRQ